jgi:hypothetical protein
VRGYRFFKCNKIKEILLNYSNETYVYCKGKVEASYTLRKLYDIYVIFELNGKIFNSFCSCKAGALGVCSHIFCSLWCILDTFNSDSNHISLQDIACTDTAQSWGPVSRKPVILTAKYVDLQFIKYAPHKDQKNLNLIQKRRNRRSNIKAVLSVKNLREFVNDCAAKQINVSICKTITSTDFKPVILDSASKPNTDVLVDHAPFFVLPEQILWSEFFNLWKSENTGSYKFSELSLEHSREINLSTIGQSDTLVWKEKRRSLLTASNFGKVCKRKKNINEKFVQSIYPKCNKYVSRYMADGLKNEEPAVGKYLTVKRNCSCYQSGLVINPGVPCLGASPDRVVRDENDENLGLLEIKTLSKAKSLNVQSITEAMNLGLAKFLMYTDKTKTFYKLNRNSDHLFQMMGQMGVTGYKWCDLLVDIGVEFYIERIHFDEILWKETMLPKLLDFCFNHLKCDST